MNRETQLINLWYNNAGVPLEMVQEEFQQLLDNTEPIIRDFVNIAAIDWEELKTVWNQEYSWR